MTQSRDGAAAYGIEAGIAPACTIARPSAASQRESAPSSAVEAHSVAPKATASQLRRVSRGAASIFTTRCIDPGRGPLKCVSAPEESRLTLPNADAERGKTVNAAAPAQLM